MVSLSNPRGPSFDKLRMHKESLLKGATVKQIEETLLRA